MALILLLMLATPVAVLVLHEEWHRPAGRRRASASCPYNGRCRRG